MKQLLINFLLVIVAVLLFLPLYLINMIVVLCNGGDLSGFLRSTALSVDRYANYEFRTLWNKTLIKPSATHRFGNILETISYALAINIEADQLTTTGKALCWVIEKIDKGHFKKTLNGVI